MKLTYLFLLALLIFACTNENGSQSQLEPAQTDEEVSFCLESSEKIGVFENINFEEGGFSGLFYIPNSDLEFFTVTDRGPNSLLKENSADETVMLFPFPDYSQKIIRLKLDGTQFKIVAIHPITDPNGNPVGGLPPQSQQGKSREIAAQDLEGTAPKIREWNFDFEGITMDKNGDLWLVDEYRPALVRVDSKTFQIQEVLTVENSDMGGTKILDQSFGKRRPNRGFEGVGATPSGKIIAVLQSPIAEFDTMDTLKTRLIRILHFDPVTGKSKIYGYEASEELKDPKIGDLAVINENEVLIIEHGKDTKGKVAKIYRLDLEYATDILQMTFGQGTSFEALANNARAQYRGIVLAQKTLVLDLIERGFNPDFGKPEGLTIIDNETIALVNDNDFGIDSVNESREIVLNKQHSCIYIFKVKL
jgi:hypothetical protein